MGGLVKVTPATAAAAAGPRRAEAPTFKPSCYPSYSIVVQQELLEPGQLRKAVHAHDGVVREV